MKKKVIGTLNDEQKRVLTRASATVNRQVGAEFTRLDDVERRRILFRSATLARQASQVWTKDRALKKKFFVRRFLEMPNQFECEFAARASHVLGEVDAELDLAGSNDLFFNVRCEESSLFFSLPRREVSSREGMLIVRIPKDVFEVQRRAQLRYRLSSEDPFHLRAPEFSRVQDHLRILDLSSGGMAIQIDFPDEAQAAAYDLKEEVRLPLEVDFGDLSFQAQGEVRYLKRVIDEESGLSAVRVGIRFVGLTQDVVEAIQLFVMEQSYFRLRTIFDE